MTKPGFIEKRLKLCVKNATKPIHKYNGGIGATLCHWCNKIISTGYTSDLFCIDCKNLIK